MFIGHYGRAFAGKTVARAVPLWAFFLAVQLVDVLWGIFIANGIEHVRIVPGFTEANAFDLYDMPITHSLPGALGWSVLASLVWALLSPTRKKLGGLAIALAVFSHWLLDLIVHVPDLELWPGGMRVGFGLWNNYPLALAVEIGVLLVGFALYLRMTAAKGLLGRVWPGIFLVLLAAAEYVNHTMPPAGTMQQAGYMAAATFLILTGLAAICDLTRKTR